MDLVARIAELCQRAVREAFAAHPDLARNAGDHTYDGVLADPGDASLRRRIAELEALEQDLLALDAAAAPAQLRWDHGTALAAVRREHFHLTRLRDPWRDPRHAVAAADVSSYVLRPYAPVSDRVGALCRHLEDLPEYLDVALDLLEDELPSGPLRLAMEEAHGHATFYRTEVWPQLGVLVGPGLARRLEAAIGRAASACDAAAERLAAHHPRDDLVLGGSTLCALLRAHEGVDETPDSLRRRVDGELDRLRGELFAVAERCGYPDDPGAAIAAVEADHPAPGELVDVTRTTLDRLRRFWEATGVVSLGDGATCLVRPSPPFMSWVTAAYDNPGPLDPPGVPHIFYITIVDPRWSDEAAEEWLRHLNFAALQNIAVHEVYCGHFVHALHALRQPALVRSVFWFTGIGEGWAHYAEQLAIEHGLAADAPQLHLAQVQDALLRACRFAAALTVHVDGAPVTEATRLFVERAHLPRLAAEREAERATYDPLYLLYTYGKMEILGWRERLRARPGFSERSFHDRLLDVGLAPLCVVAAATLEGEQRSASG